MSATPTAQPTPRTIVSTWKLTVGTSILFIDVRDDDGIVKLFGRRTSEGDGGR